MDRKRRMRSLVATLMGRVRPTISLGLASIVIAAAMAVALAAEPERVTVLFTNDLHVRVGRLAAVGEAIDRVRHEAENVLLVDAGDAWHDFRVPPLACWGGAEIVRWMNSVGYDAMAIGNHEFAVGARQLTVHTTGCSFPLLSANTLTVGGMPRPFEDVARLPVGTHEVLIVGLTTGEFFPAGMIPWMRIEDPVGALDRAVASEDREDPNVLIVVVAHFGVAEAIRLSDKVPWVDLIVTGHTHQPTETPVVVGDTLIVQGSPFALGLGRLDLSISEEGQITDWCFEHIRVDGPALGDLGREGRRRLATILLLSVAVVFVWVGGL